VLVYQIESVLHQRQGRALTNFDRALPPPESDLAQGLSKNPYLFEWLGLDERAAEADIERGLVAQVERFLLEMGDGFALVGRQHHLEVGGKDFYLDLLLYQLRLRCYVVIELKVGPFRPEYMGKLGFYLAAVDDLIKDDADNTTIGLILCKSATAVDRSVVVVDATASPPGSFARRSSSRLRRSGRVVGLAAAIRELQRRVAAGIVVMPSEFPAIALAFATLAVATVLLVQRDGARSRAAARGRRGSGGDPRRRPKPSARARSRARRAARA
jgi:predicted nuclease of restriction endonuclease-like (RecB) superfamily